MPPDSGFRGHGLGFTGDFEINRDGVWVLALDQFYSTVILGRVVLDGAVALNNHAQSHLV